MEGDWRQTDDSSLGNYRGLGMATLSEQLIDWPSLCEIRTLCVDTRTQYTAKLVRVKSRDYPAGEDSVLLATQLGLGSEETLVKLLSSPESILNDRHFRLTLLDHNDIYYRYIASLGHLSVMRVMLIHPATAMHIAKYSKQDRAFVEETMTLYQKTIRPYIDRLSAARIKWVDNILNGSSEQDKIILRDADPASGFVLLPDSKWDQKTLASLYLLAISMRRDILSLRDLNREHLPLLKNIREKVRLCVPRRYVGIRAEQLRIYIHYLPTYFYFHVHIVHVELESLGCAVGTAHLLDDVIDNIERISDDYYQRRTLYYTLGLEHELYALLQKDQDGRSITSN